MTRSLQRRATLAELPSISQKLQLVCTPCGEKHTYDVGVIQVWTEEGKTASAQGGYGFSHYFRCRDCGSAGPWEVADYIKLLGLLLLAKAGTNDERMVFATPKLFDGTIVQSPALGEEHLLRLLEREPGNAFLCTRLGNLLRGCGRKSQAAAWYEKAVALDPGDIEARYHLCCFAVRDDDQPAVIAHLRSLVRRFLGGSEAGSEELTRGVATSVVEILREAPPAVRSALVRVTEGSAETPKPPSCDRSSQRKATRMKS